MSTQAYTERFGARGDSAAESSEPSMLDQMRERLAALTEEARSIRAQVPNEFEPDIVRIQQHMNHLHERLAVLGRSAIVPYNRAERAGQRYVKAVRYVTEDDVRVGRAGPEDIIPLGGPRMPQRRDQQELGAWDEESADALLKIYESGEAYFGSEQRAERSAPRPRPRPVAAPAATRQRATAPNRPGAQAGCAIESGWLDQRFAEIAERIEQSLAQIRPDNALASLGRRFDDVESQITAVLSQTPTHADLDELRAASEQIEDIGHQLSQIRRQMARLDLIDAHLGTLTAQLSDDRLTRLINSGTQTGADRGRLDAIDAQLRMIAVQLSDERLSGLVSRSSAHEVNMEGVAAAAAERVAANMNTNEFRETHTRDLGEVRGMLESFIHERRHHDENSASMLETMQQAIVRVLDRIDTLELAQQEQQEREQAPAAEMMATPAARTHTPPAMPDLIPATARVFAEMPAEEQDQSDFLPEETDDAAAMRIMDQDDEEPAQQPAADMLPPRVPVFTTASFDLDAAFSRSRDAEAEAFGETAPARSMEVLRHDFIADAHRAKLKAAAKPDAETKSDLRAGELSVDADDQPAKPRRRSIFSFRSPRVAMSLLVLLAAIPAAIFFMPRTDTADVDTAPAVTVAPLSSEGSDAAPEPVAPEAAPGNAPKPASPTRHGQGNNSNIYEDARVPAGEGYSDIDTASLPGIMMQDGALDGRQLAQRQEQATMAQMSGRLGLAAAQVTPAAVMQDHVIRTQGAETASKVDALPPATVGPFSLRMAAAKGDASAQFEVASRLAEGKGMEQNLAEAAVWYQRAASNGFAMAQFRLATLYERGMGVDKDLARARVWYERAAAQGNAKSMHNLAVLAAAASEEGDYAGAARWFSAAAEYGLADSQYNLAVLYEAGMGVEKNSEVAYKWLVLAARSGDAEAMARRDSIGAKLTAAQRAAAEQSAAVWRAKPLAGLANDAHVAGQVWRNSARG
jgi:localization factor PodJL